MTLENATKLYQNFLSRGMTAEAEDVAKQRPGVVPKPDKLKCAVCKKVIKAEVHTDGDPHEPPFYCSEKCYKKKT